MTRAAGKQSSPDYLDYYNLEAYLFDTVGPRFDEMDSQTTSPRAMISSSGE